MKAVTPETAVREPGRATGSEEGTRRRTASTEDGVASPVGI